MAQGLTENAAGRMVLTEINGRPATPFMGVGKYQPTGNKATPGRWVHIDLGGR